MKRALPLFLIPALALWTQGLMLVKPAWAEVTLDSDSGSTAAAKVPGQAVAVGQVTLTATFNSVGIELPYGGDADHNAVASVAFRPSGGASWRQGLPLWRESAATPTAFYGSLLELAAGTSYDVAVTVSDPDGVVGAASVGGTIATRADDIPAAGGLAPTYYVATTGDDANSGTSPQAAWATLGHAWAAAPAGAVVQVGPGHFAAPGASAIRTAPIALVAQYPAVDDGRAVINAGRHAVVDSGAVSAPAGSGQPDAGVWRQVAPDPGQPGHVVWEWAGGPLSAPTQLGTTPTADGELTRAASWKADQAQLATPAGWADLLYTNLTWNYGFYVDPANPRDVYLRLVGDADPNGLYAVLGRDQGFVVNGPGARLSGLELRGFDEAVYFEQGASFGVVDHDWFGVNYKAVDFYAQAGTPSVYGHDHVVEDNLFQEQGLWSADHAAAPTIPWDFIKTQIKQADGTPYPTSLIGGQNEDQAVGGHGGAQRVVIRDNTVDGLHDGIGTYNEGLDRYAAQDTDITGNLVEHLQDDAFEPAQATINWRIWGNDSAYTGTCMSVNADAYGPVYYVRNQCYMAGSLGLERDRQGYTQPGGVGFKYSGDSNPPALIVLVNNTIWTDDQTPTQGAPTAPPGGGDYGGGGNPTQSFYLRNNIFAMVGYGFAYPGPWKGPQWDEDYDYFYSLNPGYGVEPYGGPQEATVAQYRADSGQGAHTNAGDASGAFHTPPALADPTAGDLTLAPGSPQVDAGTVVPNVADLPGTNYLGPAPDLGASEAQ